MSSRNYEEGVPGDVWEDETLEGLYTFDSSSSVYDTKIGFFTGMEEPADEEELEVKPETGSLKRILIWLTYGIF